MEQIHCALCNMIINKIQFNLKNNNSKYSNTPLITFIENVAGKLPTLHFGICLQCYDLLNELDAIELRQIEIRNQVKKYIEYSKQIALNPTKEFLEDTNIEMSPLDCCEAVENNITPELLTETTNLNPEGKCMSLDVMVTDEDRYSVMNVDNGTSDKPVTKKNGKRKKHPDITKPYKCGICSKEFRTTGELKNHLNSHSNHRAFICEICGQSYKHKAAFNIHMDMHNGINPFTCVYCNKSFTQKGALVRHVPIHTGEMPYQCDECGKRFIHHTSFNIHRLSHTGQKSFKCTLCGLALMSGSHLKRHMRIHTGEKKYVCNTCGKRFAERYNLAVHEKLHTNPCSSISQRRNYNCQICDESFERKVKLEEHLVKDHQIIKSELENSDILKHPVIIGYSLS